VDSFLNVLKAQGASQDQSLGMPRFGVVTSVNPSAAVVRVTLQPEGVLTGWLPFLSPWVGNGWGLICPPSPGDQVLVLPQEGDAEHGLVVAATWSAQTPPPAAPSGEFWLVHRSGSFLKLQNDGTIQIKGDLHVAGDVYDQHGPMSSLRNHYNLHVHPPYTGKSNLPD
jgi:phage gp45-like